MAVTGDDRVIGMAKAGSLDVPFLVPSSQVDPGYNNELELIP